VDVDQLIASGCRLVISAIAPRLGFLEDKLATAGITVISISPYKRQEGALCVLEANCAELRTKLMMAMSDAEKFVDGKLHVQQLQRVWGENCTENCTNEAPAARMPPSPLPLVKSPNCVCCGTSTVLSGLHALYGPMSNVRNVSLFWTILFLLLIDL
jgi:hypothetical protein